MACIVHVFELKKGPRESKIGSKAGVSFWKKESLEVIGSSACFTRPLVQKPRPECSLPGHFSAALPRGAIATGLLSNNAR